MAAVAIDSLEYAHQLEAVGMPREQAEAVAKGLTTMFIHNFDSLVTRDYLDTRFSEFETRVEANMNKRFAEVDKHFASLRLELLGEVGHVREEIGNVREEIGNVREEIGHVREKIGSVRGDVGSIRGDLAAFHSTQKLHSWGCKTNRVNGHRTILPIGGYDDQTYQETGITAERAGGGF